MRKKVVAGIAIITVLLLGYLIFLTPYNHLVEKDETTKGRWARVETQYQRRMDLIPNIVRTVKGYAEFEKSTLTSVIEARAKATSVTIDPNNLNPEQIRQFQQSQDNLSGALSRLLVTVERYPNLKAERGFSDLRAQLEGTENRITVARNDFNAAVQDFNFYIRRFPTRMVASLFGFQRKGYFESSKNSEISPEVNF